MKRAGITCALPLRLKQAQLERESRAARRAQLRQMFGGDGPTIAAILAAVSLLLLVTSWLK